MRRSPDERRSEIAEAARAIALSDGLSAVSLRAIARRTAVTSALVAHYAPVMDELVAQVFTRIVADELDEISQLVPGVPADEALTKIVRTLLGGTRDDVTGVWVEAWALGRRNETLAAAVRDQMDAWQRLLLSVIEAGVAEGAFEVDDPAGAAWQLLGMIDGLNAQSLVRWGDTARRSELLLRMISTSLRSAGV